MSDEHDTGADDPRTSVVLDVLRELPSPTLDSTVAARVLARAKVHLEPAVVDAATRVRFALAQALIPTLLGTVVVDHIAETAAAVNEAYGKESRDKSPRR
jgi:hypothetical protein